MTTFKEFQAFHGLWLVAQKPMSNITRWSNFPDYGQTLVEHVNSVSMLAMFLLHRLSELRLDALLVVEAIKLHDCGEPLALGDVIYDLKTDAVDVAEWEAFREKTKFIEPLSYRYRLHQCFLLQFCNKDDISLFDEEAQRTISSLRILHPIEADLFEFIERYDYLLSAYEGYRNGVRNHEETMVDHTVKRQVRKIDALVDKEPVLRRLWTEDLKVSLIGLCTE